MDVGVATVCAFCGKRDPSTLVVEDLDSIAGYMEENYIVDPLKAFLTVAFPDSGFTNPAFKDAPEKRREYASRVLRAYRPDTPLSKERCAFSGDPAVDLSLDIKGDLARGRAFRQHIPLITGEGVVNFHPYGDAGLPVSGWALLALQAFPLGCAKVGGRLLAVHSDDTGLMYRFARRFLEGNLRAIESARLAGEKKLPEAPHRASTLLIDTFLEIEREQEFSDRPPATITAYHLSNSGQGVALDIYELPLEITDFLRTAMLPQYGETWDKLRARGWEIVASRKRKAKSADDDSGESGPPRYNVLYEDLFNLPTDSPRFIRRYFLRVPARTKFPGDPRSSYSFKTEAELVSWKLAELFLKKVVGMDKTRIQEIKELGDSLASYVNSENDRRFFQSFLTVRRYDDLRATLIRAEVGRLKAGGIPLVSFDRFVKVFEEGEDVPYSDWRLARDLVLIRMIEQLHEKGWITAHQADLPAEEAPEQAAEKEEVPGSD